MVTVRAGWHPGKNLGKIWVLPMTVTSVDTEMNFSSFKVVLAA